MYFIFLACVYSFISDLLGKGYGWPSSHAQFMTFFTVHLLLSLYTRLTLQNMIWKHLIAVIVIVDCIFVCYSR